jgi:hypothetical protein
MGFHRHNYWIGHYAVGYAQGQHDRTGCGLSYGPYVHTTPVLTGSFATGGDHVPQKPGWCHNYEINRD